jgi:hypothetical protein
MERDKIGEGGMTNTLWKASSCGIKNESLREYQYEREATSSTLTS